MLLQRTADKGLWDSLQEMDSMRRRLNRIFSSEETSLEYPAVRIWVSEEGALVQTEVPGLSEDEIELLVTNEVLTIKGSRDPENLEENERYHRQERGFGQFSRSIKLPFRIDSERVSAKLHAGVMRIELPRAESDRAKRISVKSA